MRFDPGSHIGFQAIVLFVTGAFLIGVALFDAPFFFDHPKARGLVQAFGRDGSRVVCGIFGIFLAGLAYWLKLAFR